ncbi:MULTISPECIES: hypothetical protein [Asanoa]|uniref:Uncharacterized protein n=2 Tax=Asanoa TaxID=195964 RepID=A0A239PI33_9ACTN|nr:MULTISPECIES: hypothetical protein [Asanoa]GIF75688.1 hypothetical protein Asi02nite_52060 [Asanoa siamensis]SNT66278.1 hypothetical protein SAMN05421812_13625 [Asanoa hainanensis]
MTNIDDRDRMRVELASALRDLAGAAAAAGAAVPRQRIQDHLRAALAASGLAHPDDVAASAAPVRVSVTPAQTASAWLASCSDDPHLRALSAAQSTLRLSHARAEAAHARAVDYEELADRLMVRVRDLAAAADDYVDQSLDRANAIEERAEENAAAVLASAEKRAAAVLASAEKRAAAIVAAAHRRATEIENEATAAAVNARRAAPHTPVAQLAVPNFFVKAVTAGSPSFGAVFEAVSRHSPVTEPMIFRAAGAGFKLYGSPSAPALVQSFCPSGERGSPQGQEIVAQAKSYAQRSATAGPGQQNPERPLLRWLVVVSACLGGADLPDLSREGLLLTGAGGVGVDGAAERVWLSRVRLWELATLDQPAPPAGRHGHRVEIAGESSQAGGEVAVYDLGGGTFDAAVVRPSRAAAGGDADAPPGGEGGRCVVAFLHQQEDAETTRRG